MKSAVIVFPGSNCDRDIQVALAASTDTPPTMVWHGDSELPDVDLIAVPGGFSYGDYLRAGSMAANSPIMREVVAKAKAGTPVLGICNGFQILCESGLLPGALLRNAGLRFVCRDVQLKVENAATIFTKEYDNGAVVRIPVAHHDGNYFADDDTLQGLEDNDRVAFRYCNTVGEPTTDANPNGSAANIAGIINEAGNVLGMMPHPERLADAALGGIDGKHMFDALAKNLAA
ncbi:MAG: phosphoribosylformylglycinamidine synthase subunit PurQ [Alphaproteobacteria bacterium]|nr:phosphoribosylformylglycinamidine synthase subunit PurQ [Alphaproteobacteria bacterium]